MSDGFQVGELAAVFLIILVGITVLRILQGTDPNKTILAWFGNHPDLFVGVLVFLVVAGGILNALSRR